MKFVFDLDGTICFHGAPVSARLIQALKEVEVQKHEVIFASARPIRDLLPVLDPYFHGHTLIGGNGALIAQEHKIVSTVAFDIEEQHALFQLIEKYHATYLIDSQWDYAYTGGANHPIKASLDPLAMAQNVKLSQLNEVLKVLILTATDLVAFEAELAQLPVEYHVHGNEEVLDISPTAINKWTALEKVGVKSGEFVAFGNDQNDCDMFKQAKVAVQIGKYASLQPYATYLVDYPSETEIELAILHLLEKLAQEF